MRKWKWPFRSLFLIGTWAGRGSRLMCHELLGEKPTWTELSEKDTLTSTMPMFSKLCIIKNTLKNVQRSLVAVTGLIQKVWLALIMKKLELCESRRTTLGNGLLLVCGSMLPEGSVGSAGGPTDQYDIPTVVTCWSLRDELFHRAAAIQIPPCGKIRQFSCSFILNVFHLLTVKIKNTIE